MMSRCWNRHSDRELVDAVRELLGLDPIPNETQARAQGRLGREAAVARGKRSAETKRARAQAETAR